MNFWPCHNFSINDECGHNVVSTYFHLVLAVLFVNLAIRLRTQ